MFHLAYGANLNTKQFIRRCKEAKKIGKTYLKDYRLLFRACGNGNPYLTVEKCLGKIVPIGIWSITKEDEIELDSYEGVQENRYRKEMIRLSYDGAEIEGMIYIMNNTKPTPLPDNYEYYTEVEEGYEEFGFDKKYLIEAKEEVSSCQ
ncbi:MAG: gamma-glutamylcyclotransferase [Elusimicrobiota bacterium]|jgi:hypothetical protein|nr:gamma-glutamylcyclotransferase [Elusimicrobiota bacterium]